MKVFDACLLALGAFGLGMCVADALTRNRNRKLPSAVAIDYPPHGRCDVTAVGCSICKNVMYLQRVEQELPTFCPYCGTKFENTRRAEHHEMSEFIIPDE